MKPSDKFTVRLVPGRGGELIARCATLEEAIAWGFDRLLENPENMSAHVTLTSGPGISKTVVSRDGSVSLPNTVLAHVYDFLPSSHPAQGSYVLEWHEPGSGRSRRCSADAAAWALTLAASVITGGNAPSSITLCGRGMRRPLVLSLPVATLPPAPDDTQERVCGVLRSLEFSWRAMKDQDMFWGWA